MVPDSPTASLSIRFSPLESCLALLCVGRTSPFKAKLVPTVEGSELTRSSRPQRPVASENRRDDAYWLGSACVPRPEPPSGPGGGRAKPEGCQGQGQDSCFVDPSCASWHQTLDQAQPCSFIPGMPATLSLYILQASVSCFLPQTALLRAHFCAPPWGNSGPSALSSSGPQEWSPPLQLHRLQWSLRVQCVP